MCCTNAKVYNPLFAKEADSGASTKSSRIQGQ